MAPKPVATDRHGFVLAVGDTVKVIGRRNHLVIEEIELIHPGSSPAVFLLHGTDGRVEDASITMVPGKFLGNHDRADFCEACFNYYTEGVHWYKNKKMVGGELVYSTCAACRIAARTAAATTSA